MYINYIKCKGDHPLSILLCSSSYFVDGPAILKFDVCACIDQRNLRRILLLLLSSIHYPYCPTGNGLTSCFLNVNAYDIPHTKLFNPNMWKFIRALKRRVVHCLHSQLC